MAEEVDPGALTLSPTRTMMLLVPREDDAHR